MGKVARSFNGFPPSVSLNTSGYFGGSPEVSAWNHRSFLAAKIQTFLISAAIFENYFFGSINLASSCLNHCFKF